jgi:DNA-binding transcriptional ArsR family regulator
MKAKKDKEDSLQVRAKLFRGLGDPSRLSCLEALLDGPKSISEIVKLTGLSQPNVSTHMACLLGCRLVKKEENGRYVIYSISDKTVLGILKSAHGFLVKHGEYVSRCERCSELIGSKG